MAGGRPAGHRARHPGAEPTQHQGGQALFFKKLLKGPEHVPRVVVTDKLKSYAAAKRTILPGVEQGYGGSWVTTV